MKAVRTRKKMKALIPRPWLLATLAGAAILAGGTRLLAEPKEGKPAPAFTAETLDGKKIALADHRGKSAVILNYYANF